MSESKNVAVDILRAEAARREVLIAELQSEAKSLLSAAEALEAIGQTRVSFTATTLDYPVNPADEADIDEGRGPVTPMTVPDAQAVAEAFDEMFTPPKPQPPRERAFGPRVQHLSPENMPRPS